MSKFDYKDLSDIKVIGFDLDQTLYPRNPGIDLAIRNYIYAKVADAQKVDLDEAKVLFDDAYDTQGLSGSQALAKLNVDNPGETMQLALEEADISRLLSPISATIELIDELKVNYSVDMITGSHRSIALEKLIAIDINKDKFVNLITGDQYAKSNGSAFEEWLLRYPDYKPENFIYIGDRVSTDSIVPAGYGIRSILVNSLKHDDSAKGPQLSDISEIEQFFLIDK